MQAEKMIANAFLEQAGLDASKYYLALTNDKKKIMICPVGKKKGAAIALIRKDGRITSKSKIIPADLNQINIQEIGKQAFDEAIEILKSPERYTQNLLKFAKIDVTENGDGFDIIYTSSPNDPFDYKVRTITFSDFGESIVTVERVLDKASNPKEVIKPLVKEKIEKQISKQLSFIKKNAGIKSDEDLRETIELYYKLNKCNVPKDVSTDFLNGNCNFTMRRNSCGEVKAINQSYEFIYNQNRNEVRPNLHAKKLFEGVVLIGKNRKSLQSLIEELDTLGGDLKVSHRLNMKTKRIDVSVSAHPTKVSVSLEPNKRGYKAAVNEIKRKMKSAMTEYDHKLVEQIGNCSSLKSYLAFAVADTILHGGYATKSILTKRLRGLQTSAFDIKNCRHDGNFNLMTEDDIRFAIARLCQDGIVQEKRVKGTYTDYYRYIVTGDGGVMLRMAEDLMNKKVDFNTAMNTDSELVLYAFLHSNNPVQGKEKKAVRMAEKLLDHPALYCADSKAYIDYFVKSPAVVEEYIKALIPFEEDKRKKKILKLINAA